MKPLLSQAKVTREALKVLKTILRLGPVQSVPFVPITLADHLRVLARWMLRKPPLGQSLAYDPVFAEHRGTDTVRIRRPVRYRLTQDPNTEPAAAVPPAVDGPVPLPEEPLP